MKKISLSLLVVLLFIFALASIAQAFQNEPDGFRGLKWGDPPTEDMTFIDPYISIDKLYNRENDKLSIGDAKLQYINYHFDLYSDQFRRITAGFSGEINYRILKIIFEERYGEPTRKYKYSEPTKEEMFWDGEKASIMLSFDSEKSEGYFGFVSREFFHIQIPEDNREKIAEKAKDDF
jgi:hypothetical protein